VKADALAAVGVAVIVIWVSFKLGKKSVDDLLDRIPAGLQEKAAAAAGAVAGVEDVSQVRLRRSGPEMFADVTLSVDRAAAFEGAHRVADRVEEAVRRVIGEADVVVHVEPVAADDEEMTTTIRVLAARRGLNAHEIRVYDDDGRRSLELDLEMDGSLDLEEAHRRATAFEQEIRRALPELTRIVTHLEPAGDAASVLPSRPAGTAEIEAAVAEFLRDEPVDAEARDVTVQQAGEELAVSFRCTLDPATNITDAHDFTERLKNHVRRRVPGVGRVVIHVEPAGQGGKE
jgi:divalent metal cation (Fe/Co/Zn/Cd) transporter